MAEINTRLHYKINGVTDEIKCYTTLTEVQNQGIPVKVGGVVGYAKYGPASDANASRGNYKPPGGTAQRILKQAQVPYGEKAYTTPGTYTFTVPAGITKVKVAMCGGGTGHNGSGLSYGGKSSFGSYLSASTNGSTAMSNSAVSIGYKLSFTGEKVTQAYTGYGHGGSIENGQREVAVYCSNFATTTIAVTGGESISCVVGAGGAGYSNSFATYRAGGNGFVYVAWGGDIK